MPAREQAGSAWSWEGQSPHNHGPGRGHVGCGCGLCRHSVAIRVFPIWHLGCSGLRKMSLPVPGKSGKK